jgi:hypothetical protein
MQETWTFDYSTPMDSEFLSDFLLTKSKDLGIFLSYYFKSEGALAENAALKNQPSFDSPSSGSFDIEFDLVHFNACLAINEKEKSVMKIEFHIDEKANQLKLIGAYWPERGMDEI